MNNTTYQQMYSDIIKAITFLRTNEHTIPDETIDFIKHAAIKRLNEIRRKEESGWQNLKIG